MAHCTLIFLNRSDVTLATGTFLYLNTPKYSYDIEHSIRRSDRRLTDIKSCASTWLVMIFRPAFVISLSCGAMGIELVGAGR